MAITTLDGFLAAPKQDLVWAKTGTRTLVAAMPYSVFGIAGDPGAGTENVGNTANGVVPTDAVAGYPVINAFGGGAAGYVTRVDYASSVACRLRFYDRVFACGAYNFNSDVTLASAPSYSGRVPGGTDYTGCELWVETLVAPTGNLAVQVNYLDQGGAAGDTGAVGIGGVPPVGRMWQLPLTAGDSGVSAVVRVRGSVATVGASCFNVSVLRPLTPWLRVKIANDAGSLDLLGTGAPVVFADSAIFGVIAADSTAVGLPSVAIQVANG